MAIQVTEATKIYVDDIGTVIDIEMHRDISAATELVLHVRKPNGEEKKWIPWIEGTTKLRYFTVEGDLNVAGIYYIQPEIRLGSWWGFCKTTSVTVSEKYA